MVRKIVRILVVVCAVSLFSSLLVAQAGSDQSAAATSAQPSKSKKSKRSSKASRKNLVDVNSATSEQLASLPGVGDATAQQIVAGRPYHSKRDLLTRKIVSQSTYDGIKDKIVAHRAAATSKGKKSASSATR